jgi:hypothetical protein
MKDFIQQWLGIDIDADGRVTTLESLVSAHGKHILSLKLDFKELQEEMTIVGAMVANPRVVMRTDSEPESMEDEDGNEVFDPHGIV